MAKDISEEKEKKEEEKKESESKVTWWKKVPLIWKIVGAIVIFIQFSKISQEGGSIQQLWLPVLIVIGILYLLGKGSKEQTNTILSPTEAEAELRKEIKRRIKEGNISRFAKVEIGNNGYFSNEGILKHYIFGVRITDDYLIENKKATVMAQGETKGYVTISGNPGDIQGTEQPSIRTPPIFKDVKKYDLDYEKFLWGDRRR